MRHATVADAAAIKYLAELAFKGDELFLNMTDDYERISVSQIKDMLGYGVFLVGEERSPRILDGSSLGACVYVDTRSTGKVAAMSVLAVHPDLRGEELSMQVLEAAFNFMRARGYETVESDVIAVRPWLKAFYERSGWIMTGETKAWPAEKHRFLKKEFEHLAPEIHIMMRHSTRPTVVRQSLEERAGDVRSRIDHASKPGALHPNLVREFWSRGFAVAEGVFSDAEMDVLVGDAMALGREQIEATEAQLESSDQEARTAAHVVLELQADLALDGRRMPRKVEQPFLHERGASFRRIAADTRLLTRVRAILGLDADSVPRLLLNQCFMKAPGCGSAKPLHQDNYFFECFPENGVVTAWIAFDDARVDNGCLRYIEGSHMGPLLSHSADEARGSERWSSSQDAVAKAALSKVYVHDGQVDASRSVAACVRRGGVVFHHGNAVHGSLANSSADWRRAFSTHWAVPSARSLSSILDDSRELQAAFEDAAAEPRRAKL